MHFCVDWTPHVQQLLKPSAYPVMSKTQSHAFIAVCRCCHHFSLSFRRMSRFLQCTWWTSFSISRCKDISTGPASCKLRCGRHWQVELLLIKHLHVHIALCQASPPLVLLCAWTLSIVKKQCSCTAAWCAKKGFNIAREPQKMPYLHMPHLVLPS